MFEVKLHNTSIYGSATSIYVTNGDHNLVEIAGEDLSLVETVLQAIEQGQPLETIFAANEARFNHDRAYFDQVIDWLLTSKVLERVRPAAEQPQARQIATHVYCPSLSPAQHQTLVADGLAHQHFTFALVPLAAAELIVVFAPLFESQDEILQLNAYAYAQGIPLCHVAVDAGTFTIGPLVDPALKTPCLCCYNQRKLANLRNARKTLSFIRHPTKTRIRHTDISQNPYLPVALTHLKVELVNYFLGNTMRSPILGKSLVFDHLDYSISASKVLCVPGCAVCNPDAYYRVFNL